MFSFPILLLVSWVEMQWHFLFWRKSNLDDCGALTAAVSGCGIKLVKGEAFESREGFRNRKSNTQKNPTHEEGQINSSHFSILSLLWNAPCLVGFCVQRWCEHPRAFTDVLQQGWSTLGLFNLQSCPRDWPRPGGSGHRGKCLSSCHQLLSCMDSSLRQVYLPFFSLITW